MLMTHGRFGTLLSLVFALLLVPNLANGQDPGSAAHLSGPEIEELTALTRTLRAQIQQLEGSSWSNRPLSVENALKAIPRPHTPANIFRWVRDTIDFEPYAGALRGPVGSLAAGSGNAVDQALLLRALFEAAGHRSRFVIGTLHPADTTELLRQFAGTASVVQIAHLDRGGLFDGEDAAELPRYQQLLQNHVWVEVDEDGTWRPADPVLAPLFGMTTARANSRTDTLPNDFDTALEIQLVGRLQDGQQVTHLTVKGPLSQFAYRAVTLGFSDDVTRRGAQRPTLTVDGRSTHGQPVPVGVLEHLELRYTMTIGRRQSRWTQTLFRKGSGANIFNFDQQHFSLTVLPGWTSNDQVVVQATRGVTQAATRLEAWLAAERRPAREKTPVELRRQVQEFLDDAGPLLALAYVRNLDRVTFAMADALGVRPILQSPRIVTTAIMRQGDRFFVDVELRGDLIEAMPMKGVPAVTATGFLGLYGRVKNQLEGELIQETMDRRATTVHTVFQGAQRQRIPFVTITAANLEVLDMVDIDGHLKQMISEQVSRRGVIILAPSRTVAIDGLSHYGWWALSPDTGFIEGYTHDALLMQRSEAPQTRPSRELYETMRSSITLAHRNLQAVAQSTQATSRYTSAICPARTDLLTLNRATCATRTPLDLPLLSACLIEQPAEGGDLLSFTVPSCASQIVPAQCGAVVVDSILRGRLTILNPMETAELQQKALANEPFSLPRGPVCR
jgi:hypothetical protein